ncbi:MAG: hypothetical protein WC962_10710 [Phycisphaerae bacterium]|jgi:hypothetical protein
MQHIDIVVPTTSLEPFYFTMVGCAHLEAALHHERLFDAMMKRRAALPNHRFGFNGDLINAILARDEKRYSAHETKKEVAARTDYCNAAIEIAIDKLSPYATQIDMIGLGNHEYKVIQKDGVDLIDLLCKALKAEGAPAHWGGYCGMLTYHFADKKLLEAGGKLAHGCQFRALYHHGFSGGRGKGIIPIKAWSADMPDFDACYTAHSHAEGVFLDPKMRQSKAYWRDGQVAQREAEHDDRYYVITGTYLKGYTNHGELPDYGERAAHPPRSLATPLTKVTPQLGHGISIEVTI